MIFLAGLAESFAQAPPEELVQIEQLDLAELLGTVSAASKREESLLHAPAAVTVLDRDQIRSSGVTSIPELLRTVPGVQVYRNAPGNWVVSLRGMNGLEGNNVVVLLDGAPLNRRLDAHVDWSSLPVTLEDLERIEVVRGPVSTLYGANAYTGVIALISRREAGLRATGTTSLDPSGSLGGMFVAAVGRQGERGGWSLRGNGASDRTLADNPVLERFYPDSEGSHAEWDSMGLGGQASGTLGKVHLQAGVVWAWGQISGIDQLTLDPIPLETETVGAMTGLEVDGPVQASLRADFLHGSAWRDDDFLSRAGHGIVADEASVSGELSSQVAPILGLRLGARGGGALVTAPILNPSVDGLIRPFCGVWSTADLEPSEAWLFSGGVRVDGSGQVPNPQGSLRLSAIHHRELWSARLTFASAFREPSYLELGARFVDPETGLYLLDGDPTLPTPRITSLEAGLVLGERSGARLMPTVFVQRMRDLVVENFESLVHPTYGTDPGGYVTGAELEADTPLFSGVEVRAGLAFLHWLDEVDSRATAGVSEQNASLTSSLAAHGRHAQERISWGAWASLATERRYDVVTGVPPEATRATIPTALDVGAQAELHFGVQRSMSLGLAGTTSTAAGRPEGPLPWAAQKGSTATVSLRWEP
jgi:outer membrane receptor protein involved in Fe transport